MDNADIGRLIRGMRLEKGLSQRELAEKLGVCGKTVSKWECGMGAPDIQLWSALSRELGIDLATLHEGRMDVAKKDNGKLSRMRIHVCPSCGNVVVSSAEARISCCGRSLAPLEVKAADEAHLPAIERIGDDPAQLANATQQAIFRAPKVEGAQQQLGSDLTRVKRIRYADGVGVGSDDSYYLSSTVPGLTPQIAEDSIYRYLEEDLNIKIGSGTRDITVERPTKDDLLWLDVGDFGAVAVVRGKTYRIDGTLMEYTETKQVPSFFAVHETVFRSSAPRG